MNVSRSSGLGTKKTILALGVALLPAWSWAQSSVTLYGTLDTGLLFTSKTHNPTTGTNGGKQVSLINGGLEPSISAFSGRKTSVAD